MGDYKRYVTLVVAALLILGSAASILNSHAELVFDQKKLVSYTFSSNGYPPLESGISSFLLSGLHNLLDPLEPTSASLHLRILATVFYLGAGLLLFRSLGADWKLTLLFLLLLFTSRFAFLWLSSELFAGAFLMLLLWSVARNLPFAFFAIFVALFSLAKPDLLISGGAVGLFLAGWYGQDRGERVRNLGMLLGALLLLLLPGIILDGSTFFQSQGRALYSFRQHYAAMVANHQMTLDRPDPWVNWQAFFYPVWGQRESLVGVILSNPAAYVDFVFLSLSQSLKNAARSNLILLAPLAIYSWVQVRDGKLRITTLLLLLGFVPITLLSFMHTRYVARFYPLLLFPVFVYLAREEGKRGRAAAVIVVCLLALLVMQVFQLIPVLRAGYWFPD